MYKFLKGKINMQQVSRTKNNRQKVPRLKIISNNFKEKYQFYEEKNQFLCEIEVSQRKKNQYVTSFTNKNHFARKSRSKTRQARIFTDKISFTRGNKFQKQ